MTQLKDIRDLENLEIKSLDEICLTSFHQPSRFLRYKQTESQLVKEKKVPSLSAYIMYEYHFNRKSIRDIARELNSTPTSLRLLMKKMQIPSKNKSESLKDTIDESFAQRMRQRGLNHLGLTESDVLAMAQDYIYFDDSLKEIAANYGLKNETYITNHIRQLVQKGKIDGQDYSAAKKRRHSLAHAGENNPLYGKKMTESTKKKISEARKGKKHSEESKNLMSSQRSGENNPTYGHSPSKETLSKIAESKRKNRKNKYMLDHTYFDSKSEAATAKLLEKYIPNYSTLEGITFQANGDTPCSFDFVLQNAILEWHPIRTDTDPSKKDRLAYRELRDQEKTTEEKKAFKELEIKFREDLATEYWFRRQLASDQSQIYKGKEVILARDFDELYDQVLVKYGSNVPSREEAKREFKNQMARAIKMTKKNLESKISTNEAKS